MPSFVRATNGYAATTGIGQGFLTSILELGAWVGTLINGYLADAVGRRFCAVIAVVVFCVGVIGELHQSFHKSIFKVSIGG